MQPQPQNNLLQILSQYGARVTKVSDNSMFTGGHIRTEFVCSNGLTGWVQIYADGSIREYVDGETTTYPHVRALHQAWSMGN